MPPAVVPVPASLCIRAGRSMGWDGDEPREGFPMGFEADGAVLFGEKVVSV